MSGQNKRQRNYNFNAEWEESYYFVDIKGECLLCGSSVAVPKKYNVEHHFQTNHSSFDANYPFKSELRKKENNRGKMEKCHYCFP
jgi:hypothetical protein